MIQPSALSAKSSLGTVAGTQPGSAEKGGIPGDFAALLALGLPDGDEAGTPAETDGELTAALLRQLTGKTSGKNLPDGLPKDKSDDGQITGEETKDPSEAKLPEDGDGDGRLDADIVGLDIVPTSVVPVQAPSPQAIEALTAALDKPQSASEKSQVAGNRAEVLTDVLNRFLQGQPGNPQAASDTDQAPPSEANVAARLRLTIDPDAADKANILPQALPLTKPTDKSLPAQETAIAARLVAVAPAPSASATPQPADAEIQVSVNLPKFPGAPLQSQAQTEKTGEVPALPVNTNSRDAQATRPGAAALRPVVDTTQANAAAVPPEVASKDSAGQTNTGSTLTLRLSQDETSSADTPAKQASQPRPAAAAELSQSDNAIPRAGDLQPVLAVREAQSLSQSTATPQTAPAGPAQPGKLDFAAIVDRLVEAREAAAPQAVKATIAHAEFGPVTLRFDHNTAGLSVSMTSSDPDFAPAVQAAAASGNSSGANDNGSGAPRQDTQNQQSANLASGQPQQQSQGSARGRDPDRPDTANQSLADKSQPSQDDTDSAGRDGIYA